MRRSIVVIALLTFSAGSFAEAGGPDFWRVKGIKSGEELNMRRGPSIQFGISAKLPHDTRQLLNLGCNPEFSAIEWDELTQKERKLAQAMRWCRVMYQGRAGWIYSRYLKED